MTRDEKLKVIHNWMRFFNLTADDIDVEDINTLDDAQLDVLLDDAEEDRMRHASEGIVIKKDWSDAVEVEM